MKKYETVIGLEVHAELNTRSKIYCSCKNAFGDEPNTNVCPVCMGMPGTLPVLNEKVVEYAVRMGHALNCKINCNSRMARKNYFYPDLPKAFQITQADMPLCEDGWLEFFSDGELKKTGIERIHIEEDAGKLIHHAQAGDSLIDYNRCGVPLIEIVTRPDLRSSAEAKSFLEMIRSVLLYLGISDCKMQEGSVRCDVNVSVREEGSDTLGTRCEMKNVNSFSGAVRAIEYESARQIKLLSSGGAVAQETRRWDDAKGMSHVMRSKEDAQDYRYCTEPDIPPVKIDRQWAENLKSTIPELPCEKIKRYTSLLGLPETEAGLIAGEPERAALFDETYDIGDCTPKNIANMILGNIMKYVNDTGTCIAEIKISAEKLSDIINRMENGIISNLSGRKVLDEIMKNGGSVDEIIKEKGLAQNSDPEYIENIVKNIILENQKSVNDYKRGKKNAEGYLVGQCIKVSGGKANPGMVAEAVKKMLKEI
ncbi:MAG: Asp-tRNA(Asn)/Glu-tRNA(Gln) amidotransferase subunit GatB [Porcipelethomonas sp.]